MSKLRDEEDLCAGWPLTHHHHYHHHHHHHHHHHRDSLIIIIIIIIFIFIHHDRHGHQYHCHHPHLSFPCPPLFPCSTAVRLFPCSPLVHPCSPVPPPFPWFIHRKVRVAYMLPCAFGASVSCACESRIRCEDESGSQCSGESLSCMQMSPLAWDEELTSVKWNNHRGHITTSPWSHHSIKTTRHHITASAQICPRSLLHRPCQESSNRTLVRRSSQEVSYIALANRTLVELARSFTGILPQDLV